MTTYQINHYHKQAHAWIKTALINLALVAFLGLTMRYKIAYSLPIVDQKNILQAHSNFAFAGWITQALMVLMIGYLSSQKTENVFHKYRFLLWANLLTAYGMLVSFSSGGFTTASVSCLILSILVSYAFAVYYWKDLNRLKNKTISPYWFKAAFIFSILSSLGALYLAFMMANHLMNTTRYLASMYYYLHFQYNGWFFFACMGLFASSLSVARIRFSTQKTVFWLFALACVPAYFLSALWLPIPDWMYVLVVLAALSQTAAGILLIYGIILNRKLIMESIPSGSRWILLLSAVALIIKLLLQLGSTIPFLSHLAFGFRPIVIGYLHLVLLGLITPFLLGYTRMMGLIADNRLTVAGTFTFITGVILNELLLTIQGIAAMNYKNISYTNNMLLGAAVVMFGGIVLMNIGNVKPALRHQNI